MLDDRKKKVLSCVIDLYIKTGEPVGSNAVLANLNLLVSSATIRNDMSFLEKVGLLEQPHTSAGRQPSYLGYKYYIDKIMTPYELTKDEQEQIDYMLNKKDLTPDMIVDNAVCVLSELTQLAVVNTNSLPKISVITKIEIIPAGARLYALLMITSMGNVKNKVCRVEVDLTNDQIKFFQDFLNEHLQGVNLEECTPEMVNNIVLAMGSYIVTLSPLLNAFFEMTNDISNYSVNVTGEQKLLNINEIDTKAIISLHHQKEQLGKVLESAFDKVSVVFSQEENEFILKNSSMIIANYNFKDKHAGAFGVIAPLRLDYAKIIPYIEYISSSVTKLLSDDENDDNKQV